MNGPVPVMLLSLEPGDDANRTKLAAALQRLSVEDPAIHVSTDRHTGHTVIGGAGELHLDLVLVRLTREFNVKAAIGPPRIAYKQALTRRAEGETKYAKQAGGRGHYAHVKIRLFPAERGEGFRFETQVPDGRIPREFFKSVEEGTADALAAGAAAGHPIDDVRAVFYDGSYHDVDSSPSAFRIAAAMAVRDALRNAQPVVMEPIMRVEVVAAEGDIDAVVSDLADRGGRIRCRHERHGMRGVTACVPMAGMLGYGAALRARTQGRASWSMHFDRYEMARRGPTDEDRSSPVTAPYRPRPTTGRSAIALPEPETEAPGPNGLEGLLTVPLARHAGSG